MVWCGEGGDGARRDDVMPRRAGGARRDERRDGGAAVGRPKVAAGWLCPEDGAARGCPRGSLVLQELRMGYCMALSLLLPTCSPPN